MRDALAHPAWHAPTSRFARTLARRLDLRALELPWPGYPLDAALAVAPAGLKGHRAPAMPVIVLNRYLVRRCERPVVVCPRDPVVAMRLREALTAIPDRGRTRR